MRFRQRRATAENTNLQMTAMIDIVFLLLVFFVMTFKVVVPEGDFNMKLPLVEPGGDSISHAPLPPLRVRLRADASGALTGIQLNETKFGPDFDALRGQVMSLVGQQRGPGTIAEMAEVEFDCDYGLRYEYVIAALTAVSGYHADDGSVVKLLEKIKFLPPVKPADETAGARS